MTPTRQTIISSENGNCHSAVIASLLDIPLSKAWYAWGKGQDQKKSWLLRLQKWAASQGYVYMRIHAHMGIVPRGYHEISGKSPRYDANHAVVGKDGDVFFDPHPSNDGLASIEEYGLWIPKSTFDMAGIAPFIHRTGFVPENLRAKAGADLKLGVKIV